MHKNSSKEQQQRPTPHRSGSISSITRKTWEDLGTWGMTAVARGGSTKHGGRAAAAHHRETGFHGGGTTGHQLYLY